MVSGTKVRSKNKECIKIIDNLIKKCVKYFYNKKEVSNMSKLRKIGRILLLAGGILCLLSMAGAFLLAIGAIVVGALVAAEVVPWGAGLPWLGAACIGGGVFFIFAAIFLLVAGVLGIKGFRNHEKGTYIGNIVFDVLAGFQWIPLAGAVLGLIALKKEAKEAPVEEAVEEPAE